jgi:ABC-2 type transport system ATP-binding protein
MEEADRLCDRVAIIDKGKIIALDASEKLKEEIGGDVITIKSSERNRLNSEINKLSWVKHASPQYFQVSR